MATNVLSPTTTTAYAPIMTSSTSTNTGLASNTIAADTTTTPAAGSGLRRGNTLKAYLANKNRLKERQAINVVVDPTILNQHREEASSSSDDNSSPQQQTRTAGPMSPDDLTKMLMSPVSGRRIDTELDALEKEKKSIDVQLSVITQQLSSFSDAAASASPTSAHLPPLVPTASKEELITRRTRLCEQLDTLMKKRRELLESWTRDYKNLKKAGSLSQPQQEVF
ncbi:hypothetical protein BGZ99_005583 [Dissophora globulifera]|uniref:Uncharacterized protein n=1 Tax=Dissophora globulifera TaxID=979702 RepID=A0A9P6RIN0_9FUNG|nr:hypothetical protein BGZ99_005583 [Dissophora globulifera]